MRICEDQRKRERQTSPITSVARFGVCRKNRAMNEESITYRHLRPSNLLILRRPIYFSDRLLRGLFISYLMRDPALKCWATFNRPLRGRELPHTNYLLVSE